MKKISLSLLTILLSISSFGQATVWDWAIQSSGSSESSANSITTDSNNNIYVTGYICGATQFGNETITPKNSCDGIIAKYNSKGEFVWVKSITGENSAGFGLNIKSDSKNNIIVSGDFDGKSVIYGEDTVMSSMSGRREIFLLKVDSNGELIWLNTIGGTDHDLNTALEIDNNNDEIYVGGSFVSTTLSAENTQISNKGDKDGFVAKYDSNGNVLWLKSIASTGIEEVLDIQVAEAGNIYIVGSYTSDLTIGSKTLSNAGGKDGYIISLTSSGDENWAKSVSGSGDEYISSVSTGNQNAFCVLNFKSPSLTFGSTTLSNKGNWDGAILNFKSNGDENWAKHIGGSDQDLLIQINTDNNENSYIAVNSKSTDLTIGQKTSPYTDAIEMLVCKIDANGDPITITRPTGTDGLYSIIHDFSVVDSTVYLVGSFYGTTSQNLNFGAYQLTGNSSDYLFYISSFHETKTAGNTEIISVDNVKVYPNPFEKHLFIEVEKPTTIELYNSLGQMIILKDVEKETKIHLENLQAGVYFLRNLSTNTFFKLIKE